MTADTDRWGCPDWRDAGAYPAKSDELEDWEWRWEFLRRSRKYRKYWTESAISLPNGASITHPMYEADVTYRLPAYDESEEIALLFSMEFMPDPASAGLGKNPFTGHVDGMALRGIDLDSLLIYCEDEVLRKPILTQFVKSLHRAEISGLEIIENDSIHTYKFDLLKPLDPQITRAKAELKKMQVRKYPEVKQFKKRRQNWPRHLRVIDAIDQQATPSQICLEIMGSELDVKDYDKKVGGNISQFGKDMIKDALKIMEKASRFL